MVLGMPIKTGISLIDTGDGLLGSNNYWKPVHATGVALTKLCLRISFLGHIEETESLLP